MRFLNQEEERRAVEAGNALRESKAAEKKPAPAPEKPADVGGAIAAGAEGLASGVIDTAMSPIALGAAGIEALAPEGSELERGAADVREAASGRAMIGSAVGIAGGEDTRAEYEAGARARAEEHGIASTVGQMVGGGLGIAATGGLGGLAGGAAGAAKGVAGAGVAGRLAGAAARGVVEGAAFGVGAAQNEAWVADRRLTGQQVLASAGWSGLLGGALSFGVEGFGELLGAGKSRIAASVAPKAEGAAREAVPEGIVGAVEGDAPQTIGERFAAKAKPAIEEATRADDAAIREAGKAALGEDLGERAPEFYRDISRGKEIRPGIVAKASDNLTRDAETVMRSSNEIADEMVIRATKREHVAANFERTPPPEGAVAKARTASLTTWDEVRQIGESLEGMGGGKVKEIGHLQDELARGVKAIHETDSAADAYMAADQMRRNLYSSFESISSAAQRTHDPTLVRVYTEASKQLRATYQKAADHLFDTGTWGAQGAAQREVNEAWVDFINAKKFAFGKFAEQEGERLTPVGKMPEFAIKKGAIAGLVDRFGTPVGDDALRSFDQYVSAAERLSGAIGKGYQLSGTKSTSLDALRRSVANIRGTLDTVARDTKSLSQAEAMFKGGENSMIGGVVGRGLDLVGVSGPSAMMRARTALEVNAERASKQIGRALDYLFEQAPAKSGESRGVAAGLGAVARAAGSVAERAPKATRVAPAMSHFMGSASTPEAAYERRRDDIVAANLNNAEQVRNAVADSLGALGRHDPHAMTSMVVSATKVAQYLAAKLPTAPDSPTFTPLTSRERTPNRAEIQQFADVYEAVDKPLATLSKLGRGTVSRDQVQAIAQCYPDLYEWVKAETLKRIREADEKGHEIPYPKRVILDNVLDLNGQGDRTLQPDFALQYGPGIRGTEPQPSDQAGGGGSPGNSKIAESYSTTTTTMLGGKS